MQIKMDKISDLGKFGFREGPKNWNYGYCQIRKEDGFIFLKCAGEYIKSIPEIIIKLIKADFIEI